MPHGTNPGAGERRSHLARKRTQRTADLSRLQVEIRDRFLASPFQAIAERLLEDIDFLAAIHSSLRPQTVDTFCRACKWALARLPHPSHLGPRFDFDAWMIRSISDEWEQGPASLSQMVIPCHGREWQHSSLHLPSLDPDAVPRIDLITFPGHDSLEDVRLLEYPWLCHELAHNLLFRHDHRFVECIRGQLSLFLTERRSRLVGLAETVKARVTELLQRLEALWDPTPDHRNWAHEIASDLIALWSCGPAFLAAYGDEIEKAGLDPFVLDTVPGVSAGAAGLVEID